MFDKPIEEVTPDDINSLIARSVSESDTVEFKADLPARQGLDRWHATGRAIGDYARNQLLAEIVAFANSLGGTMVLGIGESDDSPPRAESLNTLPNCADLALRLEQQAGACVEPQIPGVRFRGITFDDDGNGVVVAKTNRSNIAPHRLVPTKECYTRRGERTERMTMREIRDLVLTTRNLTEFTDRRLTQGDDLFRLEFGRLAKDANEIRAFSVVAVPLDPDRIYVDAMRDIQHPQQLSRAVGKYIQDGQDGAREAYYPRDHLQWRPILRGAAGCSNYDDSENLLRFELHNNGDVRVHLFIVDKQGADGIFYPSWFTGLLASAFSGIAMIRETAHETGLEYGVQARWMSKSENPVTLMNWKDPVVSSLERQRRGIPDDVMFPRYSVGGDLSELLNLFVRDMWNVVGMNSGVEANWEFS